MAREEIGGRVDDLRGRKYSKLTPLYLMGTDKFGAKWLCRCDCGNLAIVYAYKLKNGGKKSCGCLWITNGMYRSSQLYGSNERLGGVWKEMKRRCENENNKDYRRYGAKGVRVCDEWQSYAGFERWAKKNGYAQGMSIDRIDTNRDYCPDNCRWIPHKENCAKQQKGGIHHETADRPIQTPEGPAARLAATA